MIFRLNGHYKDLSGATKLRNEIKRIQNEISETLFCEVRILTDFEMNPKARGPPIAEVNVRRSHVNYSVQTPSQSSLFMVP